MGDSNNNGSNLLSLDALEPIMGAMPGRLTLTGTQESPLDLDAVRAVGDYAVTGYVVNAPDIWAPYMTDVVSQGEHDDVVLSGVVNGKLPLDVTQDGDVQTMIHGAPMTLHLIWQASEVVNADCLQDPPILPFVKRRERAFASGGPAGNVGWGPWEAFSDYNESSESGGNETAPQGDDTSLPGGGIVPTDELPESPVQGTTYWLTEERRQQNEQADLPDPPTDGSQVRACLKYNLSLEGLTLPAEADGEIWDSEQGDLPFALRADTIANLLDFAATEYLGLGSGAYNITSGGGDTPALLLYNAALASSEDSGCRLWAAGGYDATGPYGPFSFYGGWSSIEMSGSIGSIKDLDVLSIENEFHLGNPWRFNADSSPELISAALSENPHITEYQPGPLYATGEGLFPLPVSLPQEIMDAIVWMYETLQKMQGITTGK